MGAIATLRLAVWAVRRSWKGIVFLSVASVCLMMVNRQMVVRDDDIDVSERF